MTPYLWAAIAGLGGTVAALVFALLWKGRLADLVGLRAQLAGTQAALAAAQGELAAAQRVRDDMRTRLEALVAALKQEVQTLEDQLATCNSPAAIRDRLRVLLSDSAAAAPTLSGDGLPPNATPSGSSGSPAGT